MKLMIQNLGQEEVADFTNMFIDAQGDVDLSNVSDNECEDIVLKDVLNMVPIEKTANFISGVGKKLRKGGRMHMNGLDLRIFCRRVLKNEVDDVTFNKIMKDRQSVVSLPVIRNIVAGTGLIVERAVIKGDTYELVVSR